MKARNIPAITGVMGFILGVVLTPVFIASQILEPELLPPSNKIEGTLAHIAFAVHDVDKTAAAFEDIFGIEINPGFDVKGVAFPPSYGGATMNVKFTQFEANGVRFELLQPLDGPDDVRSPWKDFLEKHGEGVQHIGFYVANTPEAREMLISKGGKWTQAAAPTMSYVDMDPVLPITFEVMQE